MATPMKQCLCIGCGKDLPPYSDRLTLTEVIYKGNRRVKTFIVGHYCWSCYKKDFEETEV